MNSSNKAHPVGSDCKCAFYGAGEDSDTNCIFERRSLRTIGSVAALLFLSFIRAQGLLMYHLGMHMERIAEEYAPQLQVR